MTAPNPTREMLSNQLAEMTRGLRRAEMDAHITSRKCIDLQNQNNVLERVVASYTTKAEMVELYKRRYDQKVEVCEKVQDKKNHAAEALKGLFTKAKSISAEKNKLEAEATKLAREKQELQAKIKLHKKHIPSMLNLIDQLVAHCGPNLPWQMRRQIDLYAGQGLRAELLEAGLTVGEKAGSDDEMAQDVESLVTGGVRVPLPPAKPRAGTCHPRAQRATAASGRKPRADNHHSIDEAEKAFNARLQEKLAKADSCQQPLSKIAGGHSTIHGKKVLSVREQQAGMMNVKERVAQMKGEVKTPLNEPANPSKELYDNVHDQLHLSPSPERSFHTEDQLLICEETVVAEQPTRPEETVIMPRRREMESPLVAKKPRLDCEEKPVEKQEPTPWSLTTGWEIPKLQSNHSTAAQVARDLHQMLRILVKCYKIEQHRSTLQVSIFDAATLALNIRDPSPEKVAQLGVKCGLMIANFAISLLEEAITGRQHALMKTLCNEVADCVEEARYIRGFISKHLHTAPEHRHVLRKHLDELLQHCQPFTRQQLFPSK